MPNQKKQPKAAKKKVGVFSFTCDEGCSITLIEIFNQKLFKWLEKIELAYFLSIKDKTEIKDIDIALVEGAIATEKDLEDIKKIRKNCKVVIGIGNCAITGQPSGQRNFFDQKQQEKISGHLKKFHFLPKCLPVKEVIDLDDEVFGCPMNESKFIEVFERYL